MNQQVHLRGMEHRLLVSLKIVVVMVDTALRLSDKPIAEVPDAEERVHDDA